MIDLNYMNEIAGEVEILLSSEQLQQLDLYADLLVEWNKFVEALHESDQNGAAP